MKIQRIDIINETSVIANTYENETLANAGAAPLSTEIFEYENDVESFLTSNNFVIGEYSWQKSVE